MRTLLILLLTITICSTDAIAQFNIMTGRNHPHLNWQEVETERFRIIFPDHLEGIQHRAAPIAESSYEALSENLEVDFTDKIRIYLSDQDEIANGFAVPVGNGHTNIWVHVNEFAEIWTGEDKWLRKVIAHELAHIFHYEAVRTGLGLAGRLFADPIPPFWAEGLAQYQTEEWDAQRGDRWLRTAVLDDALSYEDGRSIWNSRLMYAIGNAQTRYFADRYGDDAIADLLAERRSVLFGLAEVHDFEHALRETTDQSYREFFDDWRRHTNIYYNTAAGQMEHLDSLDHRVIDLPGQYVHGFAYSPDTSSIAAVITPSPRRPHRQLVITDTESGRTQRVAEGQISPHISWHPDGETIVYAARTRSQHGSIINDLFSVDKGGANREQITSNRRASYPAYGPEGAVAFVASDARTANLFIRGNGVEEQLTNFEEDTQLFATSWQPSGELIAVSRFAPDGTRDIIFVDSETGQVESITDGIHDDRLPVWHPDGTQIAYTSLRDDLPNSFVYDLASGDHRRVTHLATGSEVRQWLPADSAYSDGSFVTITTESKESDRVVQIDASRAPLTTAPTIPRGFADWTEHRPPIEIPSRIEPSFNLSSTPQTYQPLQNLTHALSLGFPYFLGTEYGGGIIALTSWMEPLGKHFLSAGGALSAIEPGNNSAFYAAYLNNSFFPTLTTIAYRAPLWPVGYDGRILLEDRTAGEFLAQWPLDVRTSAHLSTSIKTRFRYMDIRLRDFPESGDARPRVLPPPQAGRVADLRIEFLRTLSRPDRDAVVHPRGGHGIRLRLTGALPTLGADVEYLRGDASAYRIIGGPGDSRFFLYGRAQAQTGSPLPQNFLGFSRGDGIQIDLPDIVPLTLSESDRVRGYQSFAIGNRVLFGSIEYRVPLLPSLNTTILGLASFGATAFSPFVDGGMVWNDLNFGDADARLGTGAELKNAVRLFGGALEFSHALGVAQPIPDLGATGDIETYYRIRASVPF